MGLILAQHLFPWLSPVCTAVLVRVWSQMESMETPKINNCREVSPAWDTAHRMEAKDCFTGFQFKDCAGHSLPESNADHVHGVLQPLSMIFNSISKLCELLPEQKGFAFLP